jgi:hypothetical protein
MELKARALKATIVLDPAAVAAIPVPPGSGPVLIKIKLDTGQTLTAALNPKTVRRVIVAILAAGPDGVSVILTGKLAPKDVLLEAGIAAQPKAQKVAA